jgi:hypothetical protein
MAITFNQIPQVLTPSDNDVMFVFTSNQSAQPNFEFKVEVLVNSVVVSQELIFPLSGGTAYFNVSDTIKSLYSNPLIPTDISIFNDLLINTGATRSIQLKVTERYGTTIQDEATLTSSAVDVFKASLSDEDWLDFTAADYTLSTSTPCKFLTNIPRVNKYYIDKDKSNYVSFYNGATVAISVLVKTFNLAGGLIDFHTASFGSQGKGLYNVNISLSKWVSLFSLDITDAYSYTVEILAAGVEATEAMRYHITEPCVTDRTVYFVNKLGGLDSWMFNLSKKVNRDFNRNSFEKRFGSLQGTSFTYDSFGGRVQNYHNASKTSIDLMSDWIDADVQAFLVRELYESPLVWMEDTSNKKERIVLRNASEAEPQERYVDLTQLILEFEPSLKSKSVVY